MRSARTLLFHLSALKAIGPRKAILLMKQLRVQQLLVVLFIFVVFWHGFSAGAPRADQLAYLHQVSQYTTLHDILKYAPDWNRTHSAGDTALYRPVLYFLLGLEYGCFGYNFMLWQALAISLHGLIALVLLATLWKTPLQGTGWPLLVTCLFAGSFLPSELVIWNHITGYVLFCLLISLSVYTLVEFFEYHRIRYALWSAISAGAAIFTYELGIAYCLLACLALTSTTWSSDATGHDRSLFRRRTVTLAVVFLIIPFLYAAISAVNYQATAAAHGGGLPSYPAGRLGEGLTYTAYQLWHWAITLLSPAALRVEAGRRATLLAIQRGWSIVDIFNYVGILLTGLGAIGAVLFRTHNPTRRGWGRSALTLAVLIAYSVIIAFGRTLERGIAYTTNINIYYAYIPVLGGCMGIALLALGAQGRKTGQTAFQVTAKRTASRVLALGGITLIALNSWRTYELCKQYSYPYSYLRLALIDRISTWRDGPGAPPNAFFAVGSDCVSINEPWPSFGIHIRRGNRASWQDGFSMADVLFPEKSLALNERWLKDASKTVTPIPCLNLIPIPSHRDIVGDWEMMAGAPSRCHILTQAGRLVVVNEHGDTATGDLRDGRLATTWGVEGRLSQDRNFIVWSNGTLWFRP